MSSTSGRGSRSVFLPVDLILVGAVAAWTAASAYGLVPSFGRAPLGLVAILFAPGYALIAALFPERSVGGTFHRIEGVGRGEDGTITAVERLVLAVGLSVCIVPLIGLGLNFSPLEINSWSLLISVGTATTILTVVAILRRVVVPPRERFNPSIAGFALGVTDGFGTDGSGSKLTVLLVLGLVVAASGIGFAAISTEQGEQFTEFYLVTEDPDSGEYIAGGYPEEIPRGETDSVHIGITNNEGQTVEYTVVVLLQSFDEDGELREVQRLDRFEVTVQNGETWQESRAIGPRITGENLRVTYLLFTDSPPENSVPRTDDAYRHAHFWIDVPVA